MASKILMEYPVAINWTIQEAYLQQLRQENGLNGRSAVFPIPGTDFEYYASIYPNGNVPVTKGKTCFFFNLMYPGTRSIEMEIGVTVESAGYHRKEKKVMDRPTGFGGPTFDTDDLFNPNKHHIVDGEMEVKIDGYVKIEMDAAIEVVQLGTYGHQLNIAMYYLDRKDFVICVGPRQIRVHQAILEARSPVFLAMFLPVYREAQERRLTITDFSFEVVEAAIKYFYDSSLVENVSFDDQLSLLQFFEKYDIASLKGDLEDHFISQIHERNVCVLANCSGYANAKKLRMKCIKFLRSCLKAGPVSELDTLGEEFTKELLKSALSGFSV